MVKAYPDLERGESASVTGRRHIPTRVFKQAEHLTKQAAQIQTALDGINPLNAGKRRDEAVALLQKFFPGMENFETQLKKHRCEFDRLEKENANLTKRAEASEKGKISRELESGKLKSDYNELQRFVDALPEEIRQQAKTLQKSRSYQR